MTFMLLTVKDPHLQRNTDGAARQLKLMDENEENESPVPPILRTPGIKQIPRSAAADHPASMNSQPAGRTDNDLDLPKTPELTYSLKVGKGSL